MSDGAHSTRVRLLDSTLRDGSHAIRHRYTPDQVELIAGRLDQAGVHAIGVGHGDGLGASSIQYMRSLHSDDDLLTAARKAIKRAKLAVTFQPGIGTKSQLKRAAELGADLVRIATHCTEADISIQHIGLSRELGMDVHGDLMMPHMTTPEMIAQQARIMVDAGATGVHIMDSAGALTMDAVRHGHAHRHRLVESGRHRRPDRPAYHDDSARRRPGHPDPGVCRRPWQLPAPRVRRRREIRSGRARHPP
jgi:4-hydroxy 2-oxovalerate aldolase